ncbi:hypothetical protein C7N43_26645 [Sphingobacteriales bacterium UPWRP_1]|nr:hypothetical protein B6N25_04180 [Sphingobacteriales bacterium TSM_CSS]PSJ73939.1 hypothetical protein C7N43_26645 [Sphingobacteriales bacterium UPWRP_1]
MKVLITQSNYIPWRGYFHAIGLADVFVVYDEAQYTRRDWRNRNLIKTANGLQWLTIPIHVKGRFYQKISEATVSDHRWAARHWKAMQLNYMRAPYFAQYAPVFEQLYHQLHHETNLSNINLAFIEAICRILGIKTQIRTSADFDFEGTKSEKLVSICRQLCATHYISGKAARGYLDMELFTRNNMEVVWMNYANYPDYHQLYPPFHPQVTVLDLIFNEGPRAPMFSGLHADKNSRSISVQ